MIRITVVSSQKCLKDMVIEFCYNYLDDFEIRDFQMNKQYDIYFIEIHNQEDFKRYENIKRNHDTLVYMIGPEEFDLIQNSFHYQIQLYLKKHGLREELIRYRQDMLEHIQKHFRFYKYQNGSMEVKIRLSDIFYVESLRHQIIIHSINGELHERKSLKEVMDEISMPEFIRIHKSFVVNKLMITRFNAKEVYLKDNTVLPIGRVYKDALFQE